MQHRPDIKQCEQFNRDLMREMMNQKMNKGKSFMELKILPNLEKPKAPTKHQLYLMEQGMIKPAKVWNELSQLIFSYKFYLSYIT